MSPTDLVILTLEPEEFQMFTRLRLSVGDAQAAVERAQRQLAEEQTLLQAWLIGAKRQYSLRDTDRIEPDGRVIRTVEDGDGSDDNRLLAIPRR